MMNKKGTEMFWYLIAGALAIIVLIVCMVIGPGNMFNYAKQALKLTECQQVLKGDCLSAEEKAQRDGDICIEGNGCEEWCCYSNTKILGDYT